MLTTAGDVIGSFHGAYLVSEDDGPRPEDDGPRPPTDI